MKKATIQNIEKELNEKRKMPNNLKEEVRKKIFKNVVIAICIILYFLFLFLGSENKTKVVRITDLKIFSVIFLITTISLFETAYKKDNGELAIYGIEALIVAILTLFLPYIIFELEPQYQIFYNLIGAYFGIYYLIKCICIFIKSKNSYNKSISDVKEIVKKEKRERKYEDDDLIEKTEEHKEILNIKKKQSVEENIAEEKTKRKTSKKEEKETTEKEKSKTTKKATKPKDKTNIKTTKKSTKKEVKGEPVEKKVETTPKRGRPKKQETIEKSKAKVEEAKVENTPKKRGRPRKVVTGQ